MKQRITENGILDDKAYEDFKSRSWLLKFGQALFQGLGGATLIGLVGAIIYGGGASGIGSGMAYLMSTAVPVIGLPLIAAVPLFAVACIALGTKFQFENQILDQDFNARKIAQATAQAQHVSVPSIATAMQPAPHQPITPLGLAPQSSEVPGHAVHAASLQGMLDAAPQRVLN